MSHSPIHTQMADAAIRDVFWEETNHLKQMPLFYPKCQLSANSKAKLVLLHWREHPVDSRWFQPIPCECRRTPNIIGRGACWCIRLPREVRLFKHKTSFLVGWAEDVTSHLVEPLQKLVSWNQEKKVFQSLFWVKVTKLWNWGFGSLLIYLDKGLGLVSCKYCNCLAELPRWLLTGKTCLKGLCCRARPHQE